MMHGGILYGGTATSRPVMIELQLVFQLFRNFFISFIMVNAILENIASNFEIENGAV